MEKNIPCFVEEYVFIAVTRDTLLKFINTYSNLDLTPAGKNECDKLKSVF